MRLRRLCICLRALIFRGGITHVLTSFFRKQNRPADYHSQRHKVGNDGFAEAICRLADDAALRASLGQCARAYAEANFERDAVLERAFAQIETGEISIPNDVTA